MTGNVVKKKMIFYHPVESHTTAANVLNVASSFSKKTTFVAINGRGLQCALVELLDLWSGLINKLREKNPLYPEHSYI